MMKKIIVCVFLLVISFAANAQFSGGFYAGLNGSQVDGDNYSGYYKLGLNLGVTAFYPLSKNFSASIEILYTQKGSQAKPLPPDVGYPTQMRFKLNYIEVPLLINFRDRNIKNIDKLTLTAGLSVARLFYDTLIHADPQFLYPPNTIPQIRNIHPFEFNGVLGFAYNLTDRWQINFRFTYSVLQMGASDNSSERNYGLYNNVLSFRIGYILGGKVK